MVTPTFVFSVTIVTTAILAFGTTQTVLRFSSGPATNCAASRCAHPDASHTAQNQAPAHPPVSPKVSGTGGSGAQPQGGESAPHASRSRSKAAISYHTMKAVPGGFVATISITYHSGQPLSAWHLWLRFPGARIVWMTGADWVSGKNGGVTIEPSAGVPPLRDGAPLAVTFGANGTPGPPASCFFDGVHCRVSS